MDGVAVADGGDLEVADVARVGRRPRSGPRAVVERLDVPGPAQEGVGKDLLPGEDLQERRLRRPPHVRVRVARLASLALRARAALRVPRRLLLGRPLRRPPPHLGDVAAAPRVVAVALLVGLDLREVALLDLRRVDLAGLHEHRPPRDLDRLVLEARDDAAVLAAAAEVDLELLAQRDALARRRRPPDERGGDSVLHVAVVVRDVVGRVVAPRRDLAREPVGPVGAALPARLDDRAAVEDPRRGRRLRRRGLVEVPRRPAAPRAEARAEAHERRLREGRGRAAPAVGLDAVPDLVYPVLHGDDRHGHVGPVRRRDDRADGVGRRGVVAGGVRGVVRRRRLGRRLGRRRLGRRLGRRRLRRRRRLVLTVACEVDDHWSRI